MSGLQVRPTGRAQALSVPPIAIPADALLRAAGVRQRATCFCTRLDCGIPSGATGVELMSRFSLSTTRSFIGAIAMTRRFALFITCALLIGAVAAPVAAQPERYIERSPSRDGIGKVYMGREISAVMGWQGAAWLERTERDREERTDLLRQWTWRSWSMSTTSCPTRTRSWPA
jgi:hypothetical protein